MSASPASLITLPPTIHRLLFQHIPSPVDSICLALTTPSLYGSYVRTSALKAFTFGSRVATFNSLRERGVSSDVIWEVLRGTGGGLPGYESDESDSEVESLD